MAGGRKETSSGNNRTVNALATITEDDPVLGHNEEVSEDLPAANQATWLEAILARIQELEQAKVEQERLMADPVRENERLRDEPPSKRVRSGLEEGSELETYRLNGCIVNIHPITIWRENKDLFRAPNPILQDMPTRDRSKKCDFHNDVGHNNDECRSLRNQVSAMIRKGLLRKYVVQKSERPGSSI